MDDQNQHILSLQQELEWLELVINQSVSSYLMQEGYENKWYDIQPPKVEDSEGAYAKQIRDWELNIFERLLLIMALAPTIKPEAFDLFFGKNQLYDRQFTEFGGVVDGSFSGFMPTLQTFYFLVTATNPELLPEATKAVSKTGYLMKEQVLVLHHEHKNLPETASALSVAPRWVHYFLTGEELPIEQSADFPARRITTKLAWENVVLNNEILEQLEDIEMWLKHENKIMKEWSLGKMLKNGYRALFYGPPGTGKTLTATLLGKSTNKAVYRVDLSMVVSKYIGETEKNLARLFDIAQYKNWILFFDEADSLFGKRTEANSSNDRHANQQTGFLLQRIEDYPGVIILASNLKTNIDEAFSRRFQSIIHFDMPGVEERYRLWQQAFSGPCKLADEIDVYALAENYELAGGAIINVLRHCALKVVESENAVVSKEILLKGLRNEFAKEHKTVIQKF